MIDQDFAGLAYNLSEMSFDTEFSNSNPDKEDIIVNKLEGIRDDVISSVYDEAVRNFLSYYVDFIYRCENNGHSTNDIIAVWVII